jgi:hypothetical protein
MTLEMGMSDRLIFMGHFVWVILKAAIFRVVDLFAQSPLRSFKLIHLMKTELEGIFFSNRSI